MTDTAPPFTAGAPRTAPGADAKGGLLAHLDPRRGVGRFASLDGYRAIAAIGVLVYHVAGYARLSFGDSLGAKFLHNLGNFGVATFFVLSGFLLYRPFVAAALADREEPNPFKYLRRRLLRIWPGYVVALGAFLALGLNTAKETAPDYWFTLFTLTQVYRKAYGFAGLAVAWTLCIEVAFYLALPLIAGAIRALGRGATSARMRLEAQLVGLALMVAISWIYRWFVAGPGQFDTETYPFAVFHLWLPNYLDWFAIGMALALAVAWQDRGRPLPAGLLRLARAGGVCWALTGACYFTLMLARGSGQDDLGGVAHETPTQMFLRFLLNGAAAFFFLLPGILGEAPHPINRVLSGFVPLYLGTVSYGIYLWHKVWLDKLKIGHEGGPGQVNVWLMLAVVFVLSVVSASLSYHLVERPFLRFKDSRRSRRAAAPTTRTAAPGAEVP
jgi:peptidoglycan/LPS O-acetylase OafA/YrhL